VDDEAISPHHPPDDALAASHINNTVEDELQGWRCLVSQNTLQLVLGTVALNWVCDWTVAENIATVQGVTPMCIFNGLFRWKVILLINQ